MTKPSLHLSNKFFKISISTKDFIIEKEYQELLKRSKKLGSVVFFCGIVRADNISNLRNQKVNAIFIEHYPKMTEKSLVEIVNLARTKFKIKAITIIHRIGKLAVGEQIVFVGVTSLHRLESFRATEFIIDYLKTNAPFWKKEINDKNSNWVEAKTTDQNKKANWEK